MVGFDKKKLGDILKKAEDKKEDALKSAKASVKKTTAKKTSKPTRKVTPKKKSAKTGYSYTAGKVEDTATVKKNVAAAKAKMEERKKKLEEVLHSKTHQELINAAYKAAENIGIAPWVLLRAAKWGHFTENRGKKYDGPVLDDIDTLTEEQRKALEEVLGL